MKSHVSGSSAWLFLPSGNGH